MCILHSFWTMFQVCNNVLLPFFKKSRVMDLENSMKQVIFFSLFTRVIYNAYDHKKLFVNCVELIWCPTTYMYMHSSQTTCTTTNYSWRGFSNLSLVGAGSCSSVLFFFTMKYIINQSGISKGVQPQPPNPPPPHPVPFKSAHMLWKQNTCSIINSTVQMLRWTNSELVINHF